MAKSQSSKNWIRQHLADSYVQRANSEGWRSRAIYKLQEIDEKYHLLGSGNHVVDLGAAPGSWSQYAAKRVGATGQVIAVDLLPMTGFPGVTVLTGDFREESVLQDLVSVVDGAQIDLVLSDMAPNLSGIKSADQARSVHLAELALDFARHYLKPHGHFLIKMFQGGEYAEFRRQMQQHFEQVISCKPSASRDKSSEIYLLGKNFRPAIQAVNH